MVVSSLHNAYVKEVIKLRSRRGRDKTGLFLIEGYRELLAATRHGVEFCHILYSPSYFLGSNEYDLIKQIKQSGARSVEVEPKLFTKLSYRDRPDGLVAVAYQKRVGLAEAVSELDSTQNPFFVVAESIEKPGNLGSILRSADAAALDALLICDKVTDIYNPNVVRASIGALFSVPVIETESDELLSYLTDKGIKIVAATPQASSCFTQVDLRGPIACAVGAEQYGLSKLWMERSDVQVAIPMYGQVNSLNVATAATLLIYEVLRQRGRVDEPS